VGKPVGKVDNQGGQIQQIGLVQSKLTKKSPDV